MTEDFWILAGIAALAGIVNFAFALVDERKLRRTEDTLEQLRQFAETVISPVDIPPHLQNLTKLSNGQLRALVDPTVQQLRRFAAETKEGEFPPSWWEGDATYEELSEVQKGQRKDIWWQEYQARHQEKTRAFNAQVAPQARALWNELRIRGAADYSDEHGVDAALKHGTLAGPRPIEDVAAALEAAARNLEDPPQISQKHHGSGHNINAKDVRL